MAGIQWKPEPNAITTPKSYKITYVPRAVVGYEELAAQISASNPNYNQQLVMSILKAMTEAIKGFHLSSFFQGEIEPAD